MSDSHTEPHVSGHELRAALAQRGRSRPNPLMASSPPAWEWTTDEQAELDELRENAARLEDQVERLRGDAAAAKARERELRAAVRRLAEVRPWHRRGVVAELAGRGLL
jgi:chromosome segregation ATPase